MNITKYKMKGRPNLFKEEEIVLKVQDIFWKQGYSATSLSDLSSASGAGAGSLYNTFKGGKKELFKRSLYQRRTDLELFKNSLFNSDKPIELIKSFFMSIAMESTEQHKKGCIVVNTLNEMTFVDGELEEIASQILKDTEALYKDVIDKELKKGKLSTTLSSTILAKYLINLWCGINSLRRLYPDEKVLKEQIELQLEILK